MYTLQVLPSCKKDIEKACKKNPVLKKAIESKVTAILENPLHYKPLKNVLAGERRVHVLKIFVLIYEVSGEIVTLISFDHHDDAYGN